MGDSEPRFYEVPVGDLVYEPQAPLSVDMLGSLQSRPAAVNFSAGVSTSGFFGAKTAKLRAEPPKTDRVDRSPL